MKITFTRHGESQANLLQEFSNRGLKHPLTPAGRQQAAALADALRGQNVTHLYSSPVLRAIETAIILAGSLGVEYEVVEALREYDVGILEGRSDPPAWQAWKELAEAWLRQQRLEERIEGGRVSMMCASASCRSLNSLCMNMDRATHTWYAWGMADCTA